jgi:membrane-bound inhibitor of C-type lysozyme
MRLNPACTTITCLALALAACSQEAESPPAPVTPSPAPAAIPAPPVSYACESGQAIAVSYPDVSTADLTWKGQAYTLRTAQTGSGTRYVGSGLEWRTATQDGTESATLSRLGPNEAVGTAVLERCSRPAPAPVAPAPLPGPQPVLAVCKGPQLRLSNEGGDAGVGNRVANIGVQNVGTQPCSLTGYPTVVLQDRQGRNLTAIRSDQSPGSYFTQGQAPTPVTLAPQAKAAFELAWTVVPNEGQGERVCPSARRVRVTAPGDTSPVSLDMEFTPCGGRVHVSPIRSLAEPTPQIPAVAGT